MKETVSSFRFRDAFKQSDIYKNNFSYEGLMALFEHIEQVEDDIGEEFEFDMVGICCDYTEYENLNDFNADYRNDDKIYTLDDIREETELIEIPDSERFIVGEF